jgi:hypothetical protein
MTLWRRTRTEVAGAWRSLRYDLGRGQHRRPRRAMAATAFGALAVAGATGSYFAVVNGIGALAGEPAAEPYPLAAAVPGSTPQELSNEGFGAGSSRRPALPARGPVRVIPIPVPAATTATPVRPAVTTSGTPRRTTVAATTPTGPEPCDCLTPPVPTPTAAPTYSPSATPSATEEPTLHPTMAPPTATDSAPASLEASKGTRPAQHR